MSAELSPLLVDTETAARLLSVGKSLLYQMCSDGRFGPKVYKLGRRTLYSFDEIRAWVEAGLPPRQVWTKRGQNDKL